jgi:hypothetical protein
MMIFIKVSFGKEIADRNHMAILAHMQSYLKEEGEKVNLPAISAGPRQSLSYETIENPPSPPVAKLTFTHKLGAGHTGFVLARLETKNISCR